MYIHDSSSEYRTKLQYSAFLYDWLSGHKIVAFQKLLTIKIMHDHKYVPTEIWDIY
jgi:hypothetical protein